MKKIALVTGANKGLGREVVRQLGGLGDMTVLLGSRDAGRGAVAAGELRAEGIEVDTLPIDVTDDRSVAQACARIERAYGRLDILVNNAGIVRRIPALDTTVDNLRETYETNLFGTARVIRAMLPLLGRKLINGTIEV